MKGMIRTAVAGLMASTLMTTAALAAGNHPVTGEALADDQTFTYRLLDEFSSVDPQVVEDVSGAEVVRDLFEGLYNQDEEGNLVPFETANPLGASERGRPVPGSSPCGP